MLPDTLWKGEQFQTQRRIEAAQARFWFRAGVSLWLLSFGAVVIFSLSTVQAKHFVIWVLSSAFSLAGFRKIGWHAPGEGASGEKYAPRELRDWLNATIFHGTLSEWMLWAALVGLIPVAVAGVLLWRHLRKKEPAETHIRGAQILSVDELGKRLRKAGEPGVRIGPVVIPESLHSSHVLVTGATRSGKSTMMRQLLRQIAERGDAAIIMDPEREYVMEFYDETRGDYLLNPRDLRFPGWSPWAEGNLEAQAASLLPITPQMQGSASEFYRRAARERYRLMLEQVQVQDPRLIPDMLAAQGQGKRLSQVEQGILTTLQLATASFRYLAPGPRSWTAQEWSQKRKGWCFFTCQETDRETCLPFIGLGVDSLARQLLSSEMYPAHTTWFVIDELASLPPLISLVEIMRRGGKRNVVVVIGFQEVSGLKAIYGEALTDSLLNAPSTRLLLRTNDAETQRWCSEEIGEREVLRQFESQTMGPENVRDSIHRNSNQRVDAAVLASEFGALPPLRGYLKVGHYGAAMVQIEEARLVERQAAFIARGEEKVVKEEREPLLRIVSQERRAL